jgi:hypothetical protein
MNTYTVDYFIKKFEAIPKNRIISGSQGENGYHCAVGWCKNIRGEYGNCSPTFKGHRCFSPEAHALYLLFKGAGIYGITSTADSGWNVADVNNGDNPKYQQPTPKQRILAALYDIKAMQRFRLTKRPISYLKQLLND